jgi:DNA-3-methyladenine glycosylase I
VAAEPERSASSDVVEGADGVARCRWGASTPDYQDYHDLEWGRPVGDDTRVLEKLCLEGFQSGLSWLTVLRKRDGFRAAFAGFDPTAVAAFDDRDVERLVGDAGIIRHRGKILATIANAQATVGLQERGLSLAGVLWSYQPPPGPAPETLADLASATPESRALSRELRGLGFRFVGPTTVYAAMQSLGVVNDHLAGCRFRAEAERDRKRFRVPRRSRPGGHKGDSR